MVKYHFFKFFMNPMQSPIQCIILGTLILLNFNNLSAFQTTAGISIKAGSSLEYRLEGVRHYSMRHSVGTRSSDRIKWKYKTPVDTWMSCDTETGRCTYVNAMPRLALLVCKFMPNNTNGAGYAIKNDSVMAETRGYYGNNNYHSNVSVYLTTLKTNDTLACGATNNPYNANTNSTQGGALSIALY